MTSDIVSNILELTFFSDQVFKTFLEERVTFVIM